MYEILTVAQLVFNSATMNIHEIELQKPLCVEAPVGKASVYSVQENFCFAVPLEELADKHIHHAYECDSLSKEGRCNAPIRRLRHSRY